MNMTVFRLRRRSLANGTTHLSKVRRAAALLASYGTRPSARLRGVVASTVVASLLATALMAAPAQAQPAPAEPLSSVLQPSSVGAWGPLESEALDLLAARGYDVATSQRYLSDQVRAYLFIRLLGIIATPETDRTAIEQTAADRLAQLLAETQHWTAVNALEKFRDYKADELNCPEASSLPASSIPCVFSQMFGQTPNAHAFMGAGHAETFQGLREPEAAAAVTGTWESVAYWRGLQLPPEAPAEAADFLEEVKGLLDSKLADVASEFVETAVEGLVTASMDTAAWVTVGIAAAIIIGYGIWNMVDVGATGATLQDAVDATAPGSGYAVDLDEFTTSPPGFADLLFVIMSQTLVSDGLLVGSPKACSFDAARSCRYDGFATDPDRLAARYDAPAPTRDASDPMFLVRKRDAATATVQPNVEPPTTAGSTCLATSHGLLPWAITLPNGPPANFDITSTRGRSRFIGIEAPQAALSAAIVDGLWVAQAMNCGTLRPESWKHQTGLKYVNWKGEWWTAWLHGDTFLHTKSAEPLGGEVVIGSLTRHGGIVGCTENPTPVFLFISLFDNEGPNCLFGNGANLSRLQPGDRVYVRGDARIVKKVTTCIKVGWIFVYFRESSGCTKYGDVAVELEPGPSPDWQAFNWLGTLYSFLDFPDFGVFGFSDSLAMRLVDVNACAGRSGCTTPTDLTICDQPGDSNVTCFTSPTIEYRTGGLRGDWSATLAQLTATGDDFDAVENAPYVGRVATISESDPTVAPDEYTATIDWGDGTPTSDGILTPDVDGFVVSGEHVYAEQGTYPVSVTIRRGELTTVATATATVTNPAVVVTSTALSALEGAPFSGAVASFTDPGGAEPDAADPDGPLSKHYAATIDWGDGTVTAGTITSAAGVFTVSGAHTWTEQGDYTVATTIDHEGTVSDDTAIATVANQAVDVTTLTITGMEGAPLSLPVVTFTDPGGPEPDTAEPPTTIADHYTAVIDWGDGSPPSPGTITFADGVFTVSGQHTYRRAGTYPVTVTVDHEGLISTGTGQAVIDEAPITATAATPATSPLLYDGPTATFVDANPFGELQDYTAVIDWGDQTTSPGDHHAYPRRVRRDGHSHLRGDRDLHDHHHHQRGIR